ncbi:MAG: hypothetical protein U0R52_12345 [Solirubrobacterales bacterium]
MRRFGAYLGLALAVAALAAASAAGAQRAARPPAAFFGVDPQERVGPDDADWMRAGGIGAVRIPVSWAGVEPTAPSGDPAEHTYNWSGTDRSVEAAVSHGLRVLPFLYATPSWAAPSETDLPIADQRARAGWRDFLSAAVQRYGPSGTFWAEHSPLSADPLPQVPLRRWQVWNEENFFHFTRPVSPPAYAGLLRSSAEAIRAADPGAGIVIGGLFGKPREGPPLGLPAATYLNRLYAVPGIRSSFDEVAIHPYAASVARMRRLVEDFRAVVRRHRDGARTVITELGWGSQNDPRVVAFELGLPGQARALRRAYSFLLSNRHRLALRQVFWFAWRDVTFPACSFCDSSGLFRAGPGFEPKPAWYRLTGFSGGVPRPARPLPVRIVFADGKRRRP